MSEEEPVLEELSSDKAEMPEAESAAQKAVKVREPADALDPKAFADRAKPLALRWIDNAISMLNSGIRSLEPDSPPDLRGRTGLDIIRRHFHTDKRSAPVRENEAIKTVERNFQTIRRFLTGSDSIFISVDDETAVKNTRGIFGSGPTIAAYTYTMKSISFTSQFPSLGPNCKAAVIIHQLAHYIDSRIKDLSGENSLLYDGFNFETALFNVRSYPNFAINATPPYMDERYGMTRPGV